MVIFLIKVATHMRASYYLKWFCTTLFHCGHLLFAWKTHCVWSKWNLHRNEFHFAWTHVNANNEVTLHWSEVFPKEKSQTGLSSLRVSLRVLITLKFRVKYILVFSRNFVLFCCKLYQRNLLNALVMKIYFFMKICITFCEILQNWFKNLWKYSVYSYFIKQGL